MTDRRQGLKVQEINGLGDDVGPPEPSGERMTESTQPANSGDHWHAHFLHMTSHGIQVHGTVVPARGVSSRYRMTPAELKTCLKQLNWTQEKLANAFHVSRSTVKKWAQGRAKIPGPAIVLIKLMIENSAYLHRHPSHRPNPSNNSQ